MKKIPLLVLFIISLLSFNSVLAAVDSCTDIVLEKASNFKINNTGTNYAYFQDGKIVTNDGINEILKDMPEGQILNYYISKDGSSIAFLISSYEDMSQYLIINGKKSKKFISITDFSFSSDGKSYGFMGDGTLYMNGEEHRIPLDGENVKFLVDANKFAYIFDDEEEYYLEYDDKKYTDVEDYAISPDGKKLAYVINTSEDGGVKVVVDGVAGNQYYGIIGLQFSPDSNSYAYIGLKSKYSLTENSLYGLVINGHELKELGSDPIIEDFYFFGGPSNGYAYVASGNLGKYVVANNNKGAIYLEIENLIFSNDGYHYAYYGSVGGEKSTVVDGVVRDDVNGIPLLFLDNGILITTEQVDGDLKVYSCGGDLKIITSPKLEVPGRAKIRQDLSTARTALQKIKNGAIYEKQYDLYVTGLSDTALVDLYKRFANINTNLSSLRKLKEVLNYLKYRVEYEVYGRDTIGKRITE